MAVDPHTIALLVGTVGAGVLMVLSGLQKSALERRERRHICPSCGRDLKSGCTCV
jgi:hypothetical protein